MDIKSKKTLKTCLKTSLTDHLAFSFFNIDDFICSGLVLWAAYGKKLTYPSGAQNSEMSDTQTYLSLFLCYEIPDVISRSEHRISLFFLKTTGLEAPDWFTSYKLCEICHVKRGARL